VIISVGLDSTFPSIFIVSEHVSRLGTRLLSLFCTEVSLKQSPRIADRILLSRSRFLNRLDPGDAPLLPNHTVLHTGDGCGILDQKEALGASPMNHGPAQALPLKSPPAEDVSHCEHARRERGFSPIKKTAELSHACETFWEAFTLSRSGLLQGRSLSACVTRFVSPRFLLLLTTGLRNPALSVTEGSPCAGLP